MIDSTEPSKTHPLEQNPRFKTIHKQPIQVHERTARHLSMTVSSSPDHVPAVIDRGGVFLEGTGVYDTLGAVVVLRELLNNAIYHGNRNRADRCVEVLIEVVGDGRFKIKVTDEGKGFNYQSLTRGFPNESDRYIRRGYTLINALSDRLEFNDRGNCATVYITAE